MGQPLCENGLYLLHGFPVSGAEVCSEGLAYLKEEVLSQDIQEGPNDVHVVLDLENQHLTSLAWAMMSLHGYVMCKSYMHVRMASHTELKLQCSLEHTAKYTSNQPHVIASRLGLLELFALVRQETNKVDVPF